MLLFQEVDELLLLLHHLLGLEPGLRNRKNTI
jgi:hypothetical protein